MSGTAATIRTIKRHHQRAQLASTQLPSIARLVLLDKMPDLIGAAVKAQTVALKAIWESGNAAANANEAIRNVRDLTAYLRSIGADANYLCQMEQQLNEQLKLAESIFRDEHNVSERSAAKAA